MFALQSQIAGAKVVSKVIANKQQRSTVVSAKIAHGKGGEEGGRSFNNDAFGMICKAASYSMMGSAISAAGEEDVFTQEGPITVFAADDDAFGDFIKSKGVTRMEFVKMDGLGDICKNHVVKGTVTKADMAAGKEFETITGKKIVPADFPYKKNDIKVDNATIHAIKMVIA
ncbi:unnamed protein product [Bathycoccus prasinos]